MKKRFNSAPMYSFQLLKRHKETNNEPSMTVPDETLTVRQIMEKHVHGLRVADQLARQPLYEDNPTFDDPDMQQLSNLDYADRDTALRNAQNNISRAREAIDQNSEKVRQKASESSTQQSDKGAEAPESEKRPTKGRNEESGKNSAHNT